LVQTIGFRIEGAKWDTAATLKATLPAVESFKWGPEKENDIENRKRYMAHLKELFHFAEHDMVDGEQYPDLLSVPALIEGVRIAGNIDVPIASTVHVQNQALKQNIVAQIELKKSKNKENPEKQVVSQHLCASVLNPDVGVLTLMTDLNDRWHFYWFASSRPILYKLVTAPNAAAHLFTHMFDREIGPEFPTDFLLRGSWNQVLRSASVMQMPTIRELDHSPDEDGDGNEDDNHDSEREGQRDSEHEGGVVRNPQSGNEWTEVTPKKKKKNNRGSQRSDQSKHEFAMDNDAANILDLRDFFDEEEGNAMLLHHILANELPRMTW